MEWIKRGIESTVEEVFLRNLNIKSTKDVNEWFKKHYEHDYKLKRLDEAIDLVKQFADRPIRIVGDFDVDGITSTSILMLGLKWAGCKDVSYRIPKRFSEGFGINKTIVDEFVEEESNTGLLITCDNGIAQTEVISYAKDKGFTVLVLDHHLPEADTTEADFKADIIIDPEALPNTADFDGYCGAGLCYKLTEKLLNYDKTKCCKLLSIAALGTVADVMQLRDENYVIVRNGIKYLLNSNLTMPGIYAILSKCNLTSNLTAKDIGFTIGPILNSCSRMADEGAKDAIELIISEIPYEKALPIADSLMVNNEQRKNLKKEALVDAHRIIAENDLSKDVPLVLYIPQIPEGIVGIIAGSLAEEFEVPTIVVSDSAKEGILRGSARTSGEYDIKEHLDKVSDYLLVYGGHVGAAGLSLEALKFNDFKEAIQKISTDYHYTKVDDMYYDLEIKATDVPACIEEMSKFEPYGEGNEAPVFKVVDFDMIADRYGNFKKVMGSDASIVKVNSRTCSAIGFGMAEKLKFVDGYHKLSFIGNLSNNYWNGNVTRQIEFSDVIVD